MQYSITLVDWQKRKPESTSVTLPSNVIYANLAVLSCWLYITAMFIYKFVQCLYISWFFILYRSEISEFLWMWWLWSRIVNKEWDKCHKGGKLHKVSLSILPAMNTYKSEIKRGFVDNHRWSSWCRYIGRR